MRHRAESQLPSSVRDWDTVAKSIAPLMVITPFTLGPVRFSFWPTTPIQLNDPLSGFWDREVSSSGRGNMHSGSGLIRTSSRRLTSRRRKSNGRLALRIRSIRPAKSEANQSRLDKPLPIRF